MVSSSGRSRQQVLAAFVPAITLELGADHESSHTLVPGSLLSADISGFTSLSERQSAKGRAGAEQLAEIMSACFTDLIDAASTHGGDVLKFGGDALLILFRGEQHERRAAAAGTAMQRALGASGAARRAKLAMRVGVAAGPIDVFVVGTERRELLVAGRSADRVLQLESSARPGQTLVDEVIARQLGATETSPASDGTAVVASDFALDDVPTASAATADDPIGAERTIDELTPFVPPPVVAQLDGFAQLGGEHRHATIGFLMVSGLGAVIDQDPAMATAELSDIVDTVVATCGRLGVAPLETDISPDGFKFVLSAGAPVTRGHDSDALLRAAIDVVSHPTELDLRIGVQRGRVFAGFIGHPQRWTYSMTGDCMSTAARMLGLAAPGEVIAVDDALLDTRFPLSSERLGPAKVKGKSRPIQAHRVVGSGGAATGDVVQRRGVSRSTDPRAVLFGRDEQLRRAVAVLRLPGARLEIIGATGTGTTAMLDAAIHSVDAELDPVDARARRILRVPTSPDNRTEPYLALRPAMRWLLGVGQTSTTDVAEELERLVDTTAPQLHDFLPLLADVLGVDVDESIRADSIDDAFRRPRTIDATVELLAALELDESTVITVEDAHWLDESSEALLRAIVASDRLRWPVAITSRPGGTRFTADDADTIELPPLSDAAIEQLAIDRSERALSNDEISAVVERSGGNPLFAVEMVAAMAAGPTDELPESIERLIATRIDALAPAARRVLRCAAVLGSEFDEATLQAAVGPVGEQSVVELLGVDLVDLVAYAGDSCWRFVQSVHREVAYEGLPFRERRRLHALAGQRLEASIRGDVSPDASALSVHWSRAGQLDRAWKFSVIAGDRAARMSSHGEAIGAYQRALDAAGKSRAITARQRSRVAAKLGDVAELAGRYDLAATSYQRARRLLAADDPDQVLLFRKRGVVHEHQGNYGRAINWYRRGIEATEQLDHAADHERLELDVALAGVRFRQGRYDAAIDAASKVADDVAAPPVIRLRACYIAHVALQYRGDRDRREHYGSLGSELAQLVSEPVLQANLTNNLGIAAYYEGHWDRAAALYEESFELRETAGDLIGSVTSLNNLGELRSDQRRFGEAEELFEQALRRATAAGYEMAIHVVRANLGRLATRQGRRAEAHSILVAARAAFEQMDARGFVLESRLRILENAAPSELDAAALTTLLSDSELHGGGATVDAPARRLSAAQARTLGDLVMARTEVERALTTARDARLDAEIANCLDELALIEIAEGGTGAAAHEAIAIRTRLGIG